MGSIARHFMLMNLSISFFALSAGLLALNGISLVKRMPEHDRPLLFLAGLGPLLFFFVEIIAVWGTIATIVWSFIRLPWPYALASIVAAWLGTITALRSIAKWKPLAYLVFLPAGGPLIGSGVLLVLQLPMWVLR